MFTAPVKYQPQTGGVAPLRSMQCYHSDQEVLGRYNELRGAGLSESEVELAVEGQDVQRGVGVEPSAMKARLKNIHEVGPCTQALCDVACGPVICVHCRGCQCMQQGCRRQTAAVVCWE